MKFIRQEASTWEREIPGARWFKADLHIHTIDDYPGKRAKMPSGMPSGIVGDPCPPETLASYARCFLQELIKQGVQVAGLTPHSPRLGTDADTSGVWKIIEEWNEGTDDDNVPFREKIYAIFPGFEPSLKEGKQGLDLLILFDPEIGRRKYLAAFDLVMGGISPWKDGNLQMPSKRAENVFADLRNLQERELESANSGDFLVLAPHVDADNGLLGGQKSQVLALFNHQAIAGLELSDNKLPEDAIRQRAWLDTAIKRYRQAFFHSSDAYKLEEIGQRYTWIKLASPRIIGLRQAFVASDSRVRLGFERGECGTLQPIVDPPDVTLNNRPWLREISVKGRAAFFGGLDGNKARGSRFQFSPDLNCIIGGSMTGKSTLLDGLRVFAEAPMPDDQTVQANVEARARKFSAGAPEIEFACPGRDPTAPFGHQWPARYFAQNELQRLSQEAGAIEEILARLVPDEIEGIEERSNELLYLDKQLSKLIPELNDLDESLAETEQALQRASSAKNALTVFSEAGVDLLHQASQELEAWKLAQSVASNLRKHLQFAIDKFKTAQDLPTANEILSGSEAIDSANMDLNSRWQEIIDSIKVIVRTSDEWINQVEMIINTASIHEADLRTSFERKLADQGLDEAKLKEFATLSRQAALLANYEAASEESRAQLASSEGDFMCLRNRCHVVTVEQRKAFDRVIDTLRSKFGDRIRVRRLEAGHHTELDGFLRNLRQRGLTRWWNDLDEDQRPSPRSLLTCLDNDSLAQIGMSSAVQDTFRESLTRPKRRELEALRCPDRYHMEMQLDDGSYRPLEKLSGGQRISVLLSLLLETADDRPLVIDQPEDELDNRFLSDTILPALKKLKGQRQVIIATHNANIVVNGDADMVILLGASANHGEIACMGAIDEPEVRTAIVRTVDGGEEAFRLRLQKYGF